MANLPLRSLLLTLFLLSAAASTPFHPLDNYLLNCGSSSSATLDDHRVFVPDHTSLLSSGSHVAVEVPDAVSLYRSARVFTRPSSYRFAIEAKGTHLVRLHFRPFSDGSLRLSAARFHVLASGSVLLTDFGVGCMHKATPLSDGSDVGSPVVVKEYILQVDSDELVVTFVPMGRSFAYVNAIEVVSAPTDLLPDIAMLVVPDHDVEKINGVSKHGFENLFRINAGGPKVTPFNDTLWRTWVPDEEFLLKQISDSRTVHFSDRIKYQTYGASREIAPDNIYNSARVIGGGDANVSVTNSNMTWAFEVPQGHRYLVRMHFCDIASLALNELYFNVYINGRLAYEDFDISEATGRILAAPYYVDFVAEPNILGRLVVTIAPSKLSIPSKVHGLLNGLEVMKMSNSVGNLEGDVPAKFILRIHEAGSIGMIIRFTLCGLVLAAMLLTGFMLISRWRNASRTSAGWSRLPIDVSGGKASYGIPMTAGYSYQLGPRRAWAVRYCLAFLAMECRWSCAPPMMEEVIGLVVSRERPTAESEEEKSASQEPLREGHPTASSETKARESSFAGRRQVSRWLVTWHRGLRSRKSIPPMGPLEGKGVTKLWMGGLEFYRKFGDGPVGDGNHASPTPEM